MDVVAYLRILRRHWRMIAVVAVLGAVVGAASTLFTSDDSGDGDTGRYYKATHTLFLDTSLSSGNYRPVFTNLDQMAVLTLTGDVPKAVADELGGDPRELITHLFVTTNGTLSTIELTAADRTPDGAVTLADTFAQTLVATIEAKEEERLNQLRVRTVQRLNELQAQIADLDARIAARPPDLTLLTAQRNSLVASYSATYETFQGIANASDPASSLSTLQAAQAERIQQSEYSARITAGQLGKNRVRADLFSQSQETAEDELVATDSSGVKINSPVSRGVLGGVLGLLVGVGLALVADRIDRRVRTREEFEAAYGMPVLAEMPLLRSSEQKSFELVAHTAPLSRSAEAYRAVRSSLLFQRPVSRDQLSSKALTIMVASATPKEGKSTTSANLAAVFAESGQRVLVMNCDFRRPTLHRFFGVENEPRRVLESGIDGLMIVGDVTGPENQNPAHVTDQQRRIIANSQEHFEVVILDTAPLLSTNDATELMDLVDLVLLVGRVGQTTSDNALRVRELLSRLDAPVAGVVMIGSDATSSDYYYYYTRGRAKRPPREAPAKSETKRGAYASDGNGATGSNGDDGSRNDGATTIPTTPSEPSDR